MNPARTYLRLDEGYTEQLGGLRWSPDDNVLEHKDGTCFLFTEQVAEFLEGFASVRPVLHFTLMAHLLSLLRQVPPLQASKDQARLWRTFLDTGRNLRHAGAFCAQLCARLPAALQAGAIDDIRKALRWHGQIIHWSTSVGEADDTMELPPLQPERFEAHILKSLAAYSDVELTDWLRHGRGPVREAAKQLAKALPVSLAARLAELLERPRLAGAAAFLRQLSGALTLPPRRLAHQELPVGGYADVTTRGHVDHILPSQFALDDWDFLRRYAERELLYFRREEPHEQTRHELVVLLDQGVRTWGDVRIVLGAALVALGKQALARKLPFRIATTTSPGSLDPVEIDADALASLVEASDLSPHPAIALERVLAEPGKTPRDVVLLSHPRSLNEADVRTAARLAPAGTRLFALTLDREGGAGLVELKRGAPVAVREFHVDLTLAQERPLSEAPTPMSAGDWEGSVEPIPFPFRFGIGGVVGPRGFDFDGRAAALLTASPHGMLHLWKTDGTLLEILPRGLVDGQVVKNVYTVVGVGDGFAVVGALAGGRPVIVHYDMHGRRCTPHVCGQGQQGVWQWEYSPGHHCMIAVDHRNRAGLAIDLGTGEKYATHIGGPKNRAQQAWEAWVARRVVPRSLVIGLTPDKMETVPPCATLDYDSGMVQVNNVHPGWSTFTPLADGQPALRKHLLIGAQCRASTLALKMSQLGAQGQITLQLFRGPDGVFIGAHPIKHLQQGFTLSADGQLLARQVNRSIIEINQTTGSLPPLGRISVGDYPQQLWFYLADDSITLFPGSTPMSVSWKHDVLGFERRYVQPHEGTRAKRDALPAFLQYDPQRWLLGARRRLLAASDRYGQVATFDEAGNLVCMFFAFRNRVAGWMPDGTRFGPPAYTGQAQSADALRKFAAALRVSSQ
jgi:hypothetical protein